MSKRETSPTFRPHIRCAIRPLRHLIALGGTISLLLCHPAARAQDAALPTEPPGLLRFIPPFPGKDFVLLTKVIFLDEDAAATVLFCALDKANYLACSACRDALAISRVQKNEKKLLKSTPIPRLVEGRTYFVKLRVATSPFVSRDAYGPVWYVGGTRHNVLVNAKIWPEDEPEPDWQVTLPEVRADGPGAEKIGHLVNSGVRFTDWTVRSFQVEGAPEEVAPSTIIHVPEGREAEWLAVGDLDNDGRLDFLTARNANQAVTALTAYNRDGNVIWEWGAGGSSTIAYDVPAQIYDIDGDGRNEVLYSIRGYLVVANGADGAEEKRWPLPKSLDVADCIMIANFTGKKRPSDILIKTRYDHVWAYDNDFSLLWEWQGNTGHHPCPDDVDGDGKDALLCGYTLLDHNGREIWHLEPNPAGHADTARIYWNLDGKSPGRPWYLTTCCVGNDLILTDHLGRRLWKMRPEIVLHFQSARAAELRPDLPGKEIVVDIAGDPNPSPDRLMLLDGNGNVLGTYMPDYTRFHDVIDWDGDGVMEIIIPRADGLFDGRGRQVVRFLNPLPHPNDRETPFCYVADVYNDGNDDVVLLDDSSIRIYNNPALPPRKPKLTVLRRHYNFTFY